MVGPVVAVTAACLSSAVVIGMTVGPRPAGAVGGQPSGSLTKAGQDVNTGSTTQVRAGDTIRWAVSARNTSGVLADVDVTDPVGAGQTFVPGSLQAPPGYQRQWSTDHGASYSGTDQGAATNQVRATATGVPDQGTGTANGVPAPATNFGVGEVGGDGWETLFYGDDVYNVHHHRGTAGTTTFFDCHAKSGGTSCPGFPPGGTYASAVSGTPIGTGSDDYLTPEEFRSVISPAGRMYTPVQITNSRRTGFACLDLAVSPPVSCGFLAVDNAAPLSVPGGGSGASALGGGAVVGSKLYSMTWDGRLACVDAAASGFCAGSGPGGIVGTIDPGVAGRSLLEPLLPSQHAQFVTVGSTVAGIVDTSSDSTSGRAVDIVCYNLATNARCSGFPLVAAQPVYAGGILPVMSTAGQLTGVCTQARNDSPFVIYCYNLSGDAISDPYPARPGGTILGAFGVGDPAIVGTKVYAPYSNAHRLNYYTCFDFATGDPCAGFTTNHTNSTARPYTLRQDPYLPNCIWELGDGGIFETLDATTGRSGCSDTRGEVSASPQAFYCDGGPAHVQGWVALSVANLATGQYSSAQVTVLDANGAPVAGFVDRTLPPSGQLDLSAIPATGATATLTARLSVFGADPAAWQGNQPTAVLTFRGDTPQVCLRTTAATICNAAPTALADTATLVVSRAGDSATVQASASLGYLFPTEQCPRRLAFAKRADLARADPGGTVHYTITVTNTGLVDFTAADPASFTDSLADVTDDAAYNNDAAATAGTVGYAAPVLSWSGPLAAGAAATVTYSVTVSRPDNGDHQLVNTVVGPSDVDNNCRSGQPAPACRASVPVADLRVAKTVDNRQVDPGATLTYTITVTNIGTVDYTGTNPASFTDDLTQVLDDADYNGDAAASTGTVTYSAPTLSWHGDLAAGASATVRYTVTVHDPDTGDRVLTNVVVGGTNCPPGSPDPACRTVVPSPHLTVTKAADQTPVVPGDTVTYTIRMTNDGAVAFTADSPADATDDLSQVLDDAVYRNDATATAGTVSYAEPVLHWSGALAIGASVTITYSVTVNRPDDADHRLANRVVAPHSNCRAASTDPVCAALVLVRDLSLVKTADRSVAAPGDRVTYTIVASNTGQADYTDAEPATFDDDLTGVLDDAAYSNDATATAGALSYVAPILTWTGPLAVGATARITYTVVVGRPPDGDLILTNVVIGPPYTRCAAGSGDPACTVTVPVPVPPPGGVTPPPGGVTPPPGGVTPPPGGTLPATGVNVTPLGLSAVLLITLGALLTGLGARRRRRPRH
jgi:uncharacterized repeat protein (TIGR01451 family)